MQNAHMATEKPEKTRKKPILDNAIRVYSTYNIMVIYLSYMSKLIQPSYTSGNRGVEDQV